MLDEDGAILEESDTNPYGDIRYGSNTNEVTTYYGLHERNDTTGLVDMEARMYDPTNLQFSAPDPISLYSPTSFLTDPQQMHMYAYGRNNPVRYNDPDGMASKAAKQSSANSKQSAIASVTKGILSSPTRTAISIGIGFASGVISGMKGGGSSGAVQAPKVVPVVNTTSSNSSVNNITWVSQFTLERPTVACFRACEKMSGYTPSGSINLAIYDSQNKLNTSNDSKKGLDIINNYIAENKSVIVGVNRGESGRTSNLNPASQHFIVIVGSGNDEQGYYYNFYDPGTTRESAGASLNNKLYMNDDYSLVGKTEYNNKFVYTATEVKLR